MSIINNKKSCADFIATNSKLLETILEMTN